MLPIIITKFPKHESLKEKLLKLIDEEKSTTNNYDPEAWGDKISRTDYYLARDYYKNNNVELKRKYWDLILPELGNTMKGVMEEVIKYHSWEIAGGWFQQYHQNDLHDWHYHPKSFYSNVYFLEKPEGCPATELLVPVSKESIIPNLSEGDILTFPSIMEHRSPPNEDTNRKTVIAFNIQ